MLEKSRDDQIIDLDHIFHEEDPLRECVRETKFIINDRDNTWLNETIA